MLVGRRLAVSALRSAVDAEGGGAGGVVLLAGGVVMGKTALTSEAVAYAKARGAAAVWGTCWEGDGAPGFWPWIQMVRALVPEGGNAGESVLAELTGVTEERGGGVLGDESAIRFRTYDLAATYVRSRAAQRPLVIVIEDLHWADVSSLRLLVFGALWQAGDRVTAAGWLVAIEEIQRFSRVVARFFTGYDAFLTPTMSAPPPPIGTMVSTPEDPWRSLEVSARPCATRASWPTSPAAPRCPSRCGGTATACRSACTSRAAGHPVSWLAEPAGGE